MKKNKKIIIEIFLIILAIIVLVIITLNNKGLFIVKQKENKEQLTTEDGFITTKDHLNATAKIIKFNTIENPVGTTISNYNKIDNALETWTYSTSGTSSGSNYITKNIDVSGINGVKYICIAVVSKNVSSDMYYNLTNNIISFN